MLSVIKQNATCNKYFILSQCDCIYATLGLATMAIPVMEFQTLDTKLERFLPKTQHY